MSFKEYEGYVIDLVGNKQIAVHPVFGIKIGKKFHRKSSYCASGHKTGPLS